MVRSSMLASCGWVDGTGRADCARRGNARQPLASLILMTHCGRPKACPLHRAWCSLRAGRRQIVRDARTGVELDWSFGPVRAVVADRT